MNVNKINRASIASFYQKNSPGKTIVNESSKATDKDSITLSKSGSIFKEALKAVQEMPDIRADKVNEIQAKIKQGVYKTEIRDIADKIIDNAFTE